MKSCRKRMIRVYVPTSPTKAVTALRFPDRAAAHGHHHRQPAPTRKPFQCQRYKQQTTRSTHRRAREIRGVVVARIAMLSRVLEQPLPPAHTRRQEQRLLQVGGGQRTDLVQLLRRAPARVAGGV